MTTQQRGGGGGLFGSALVPELRRCHSRSVPVRCLSSTPQSPCVLDAGRPPTWQQRGALLGQLQRPIALGRRAWSSTSAPWPSWRVVARAAGAHDSPSPGPPPHGSTHESGSATVSEVLHNLREALCTSSPTMQNSEVLMSGVGRHLGINIQWRIRWRADGAFHEEITGRELGFSWGYDGQPGSSCWEVDSSGVARSLECDDHEALLVGAWVRTGLWLQPHLSAQLDIQLEQPAGAPASRQQPRAAAAAAAGAAGAAGAAPRALGRQQVERGAGGEAAGRPRPQRAAEAGRAGPRDASSSSSQADAGPGSPSPQASAQPPPSPAPSPAPSASSEPSSSSNGSGQQGGGGAAGSSGGGSGSSSKRTASASPKKALLSAMLQGPEPPPLVLLVRLAGGKVVNRVRVCARTWTVQGLDQPLCGDTEVWQFGSWKAWQPEVIYPEHVSHQAIAGGHHVYVTQACAPCDPSPRERFQCPHTPVLPGDTSFDPQVPPDLPVWRAGSGHLLVKPRINGKEGGYMVVDTGASGFVITPDAVVALGLDTFGELFAAGIAGKIPAQFVKARSWSLGPLHIASPVMMTMPLDGLVRGGPPGGDVIGIVGYDIFRRAVIELPQMTPISHAYPAPAAPAAPAPAPAPATPALHLHAAPLASSSAGNGVHHRRSHAAPARSQNGAAAAPLQLDPPQGEPADAQAASASTASSSSSSSSSSGPLPFLQGLINAASAGLLSGTSPWATAQPQPPSTAGSGAGSAGGGGGGRGPGPGPVRATLDVTPGAGSSDGAAGSGAEAAQGAGGAGAPEHQPPAVAAQQQLQEQGGGGGGAAAAVQQLPGGCQQYVMRLYNPERYEEGEGWCWHPFRMIASLPHMEVALMGSSAAAAPSLALPAQGGSSDGEDGGGPAGDGGGEAAGARPGALSVLLMLDSGACGADIMLHARAMRELDLQRLSRPTSHFVRGVGGASSDHPGVKIQVVDLDWVELAGVRFKEVRCMHAGVGGLDISLYSAGILCGDLLTRLPTCYDYARKRMGFRLPASAPCAVGLPSGAEAQWAERGL